MDKLVAQFPKHIAEAIDIAKDAPLKSLKIKVFSNVIICGMGGSGIGGRIVAQLFSDQSNIPISVVSDYDLPGAVNADTLVIASSYSGNTEETLSAVLQAHERKATIVGVCSGGELMRFCKKNNYEVIAIPGGNPPRSMLAYSLIQLLRILSVAAIIDRDVMGQVEQVRALINKELIPIKTKAKEIAEMSYQKHVVFYATPQLEPVAIRARQQYNENAKQLAYHAVIPEMNHNEMVGWACGNDQYCALFINSSFIHERNLIRLNWSLNEIKNYTPHVMEIVPKGASPIEEALYLIHLLDWASVMLCEKNGADVMEIKVIDKLKNLLAQ